MIILSEDAYCLLSAAAEDERHGAIRVRYSLAGIAVEAGGTVFC